MLKRYPVLGGYEPGDYASEALVGRAKDGTSIPISLVYRKSLRGQDPQPLLLYGYGAYGFPMDPHFSSGSISILDRSMISPIANLRGGRHRGKLWDYPGKLLKK